jgi:eukaryotic-like serine/threonine-protein kinase
MSKVVFAGLITFALVLLLSSSLPPSLTIIHQQPSLAQTNESFNTYNNPTFGIKMQYPSDWGRLDLSFLENDSADIDFYPLGDTSGVKNVKIQVKTLPLQNMTLDEYTTVQINSIEEQLLESNATTLTDNNIPAHKIVFINTEGLKTMQIWALKDDKSYTITYVAEESDYFNQLPLVQRMIDSFQIIG